MVGKLSNWQQVLSQTQYNQTRYRRDGDWRKNGANLWRFNWRVVSHEYGSWVDWQGLFETLAWSHHCVCTTSIRVVDKRICSRWGWLASQSRESDAASRRSGWFSQWFGVVWAVWVRISYLRHLRRFRRLGIFDWEFKRLDFLALIIKQLAMTGIF